MIAREVRTRESRRRGERDKGEKEGGERRRERKEGGREKVHDQINFTFFLLAKQANSLKLTTSVI